ncbi:hypothetical protein [Massilibacteroides sp.]|uniref:hypothetical protein n=1 Tax=Massilibacteroides sp. TaxID=2034766 RepID=UPI002630F08F|nr:hypothetical protein [Massilibacteroides sp.]MDD4516312.1 hypothetical protein [Massilibacteroides sp.]
MNNKPQTPLEKLKTEKKRILALTKEQENKLNEHVAYVQTNAGTLFLSFISSMLFRQSEKKQDQTTSAPSDKNAGNSLSEQLSLADFLPLTKMLIPVAWDIAKPIFISWGIKKAGSIIGKLFSRKKA